jgi:hypothetical protein
MTDINKKGGPAFPLNTEADLVGRLRDADIGWSGDAACVGAEVAEEAAAEITKLRAERDAAAQNMQERCWKAALECGNFGDYKREELTAEYGQPRFDMMHSIVNRIRGLAIVPHDREAT